MTRTVVVGVITHRAVPATPAYHVTNPGLNPDILNSYSINICSYQQASEFIKLLDNKLMCGKCTVL
jgi:hypothetical protein